MEGEDIMPDAMFGPVLAPSAASVWGSMNRCATTSTFVLDKRLRGGGRSTEHKPRDAKPDRVAEMAVNVRCAMRHEAAMLEDV